MIVIDAPLNKIHDNPWQPRQGYDNEYIAELADDIKRNGLIQFPAGRLMVADVGTVVADDDILLFNKVGTLDKDVADGLFCVQLAVGHNRRLAYQLLAQDNPDKYGRLPVRLAAYNDQTMAKMSWSENAKRKDLSALEEGNAIKRAMSDFGWTQEQAGVEFGLNRSTIANKLRILQLPAEVQDDLRAGAITERQAIAILPLYQLPEPARKTAQLGNRWNVTPPRMAIAKAREGESSERLREETNKTIEAVTVALADAPFPLDSEIGNNKPGVRGKCQGCPMIVRYENSQRCGDSDCYQAKCNAWAESRVASARKIIDLPNAPNGKDWYSLETFSYSNGRAAAKNVIKGGCPKNNLCLFYAHKRGAGINTHGVNVPDHPDVFVVCASNRCSCLKKHDAAHPRPQSDRERESQKAFDQFNELVMAPAVAALVDVLATAANPPAWKFVLNEKAAWLNVLHVRAEDAIRSKGGYYQWSDKIKNLAECQAEIAAWLEPLGIRPNWPLLTDVILADITRRFERIKGWVDNQDTPTLDQIKGNIKNLKKLEDELEGLPLLPAETLRAQIWDLSGVLGEMSIWHPSNNG